MILQKLNINFATNLSRLSLVTMSNASNLLTHGSVSNHNLVRRPLHSKSSKMPYYPTDLPIAKHLQRENAPLVVILPWLHAHPKHVNKYIELYHQRGYDVMTCTVQPSHFLWPTRSYSLTQSLFTSLSSSEFVHRPLIFHSFSIGTYLLSVLFSQMKEKPDIHGEVISRILGFVNDSVTIGGTHRMVAGIAHAVTKSKFTQACITRSLLTYFTLTHQWTVRLYDYFIDCFYNNPAPKAPILYFYSLDDPMCDPTSMTHVIKYQQLNGYDVDSLHWESSAHAQHYIFYQQEYLTALENFLKKIDPNNSMLRKSKL